MVLCLLFVVGLTDIREEPWLNLVFYVMMIVMMFLFDRACASMTVLYEKRLRRVLMRNRQGPG